MQTGFHRRPGRVDFDEVLGRCLVIPGVLFFATACFRGVDVYFGNVRCGLQLFADRPIRSDQRDDHRLPLVVEVVGDGLGAADVWLRARRGCSRRSR